MFTLASLLWHLAVIVIEFMGTAANSGHKWWAMSQVEPSTKATTSSGYNKSQLALQGLRMFSHEAHGSRSEPTWPQNPVHLNSVNTTVPGSGTLHPAQPCWGGGFGAQSMCARAGGVGEAVAKQGEGNLYFHFHFCAGVEHGKPSKFNCWRLQKGGTIKGSIVHGCVLHCRKDTLNTNKRSWW